MNLFSKIATTAMAFILISVLVISGVQGSLKLNPPQTDEPEATTQENSVEAEITAETTSSKKNEETTKQKATTKTTAKTTTIPETETTEEPSEYAIYVNLSWNCVTIYHQGQPIKAMRCSVGEGGDNSTPVGKFSIIQKSRWCEMDGPCWAQYVSNFTGAYWFHSVPYEGKNDPSTLWYWAYNMLGQPASHGCIRLNVADSMYIYYNIPYGSDVITYYDESSPGPLGKPDGYHIPTSLVGLRGWDPTDPDEDNPWPTYDVNFTGPETIKVYTGSSVYDVLSQIQAVDSTNTNVRDLCDYSLDADLSYPGSGTFTITFDYSEFGLCCKSATFNVLVSDAPEPETTTTEPATPEPTTQEETTMQEQSSTTASETT